MTADKMFPCLQSFSLSKFYYVNVMDSLISTTLNCFVKIVLIIVRSCRSVRLLS